MTTFCSLIHKKGHPKIYHNNIKYHMTQKIMFSVGPSGLDTPKLRNINPHNTTHSLISRNPRE